MKVFLAGEGSDELGDWSRETLYRGRQFVPGIIEALLNKLGLKFEVINGTPWGLIQKFYSSKKSARPRLSDETKNVLRAAQDARDAKADALIFVRDTDRDRTGKRESDIESGIREAKDLFPNLKICGGVAKQEIEAWILALKGETRSESHTDAKAVLKARHFIENRLEKIKAIEDADLALRAKDAPTLELWIDRAHKAFAE